MSVAKIAQNLGIHPVTLWNWVKEDRIERGESEGLTVTSGPAWPNSRTSALQKCAGRQSVARKR
ncbi:MAG: hypothetical protein GY708_09275 [Actinomycetia bacterium]|nr:hypothetical protein [Actinomycetes bacterium]